MSQQSHRNERRNNKSNYKNGNKKDCKNRKDHKNKKMTNEKLVNKISKIVDKVEKKNEKQQQILKLNQVFCKKLQDLAVKVNNSNDNDNGALVDAFFKISKDHKQVHNDMKEKGKKLRKLKKEENKIKKQLKVQEKKEKLLKLDLSRIEELPELKKSNLSNITLLIDGWNICGCDKIARNSMRSKRGSGAKRLIELIKLFRNNSNYIKLNDSKNINLIIHFDGNGKDLLLKEENIIVKYSGKNEIVDDRLVRELSANLNGNDLDIKLNLKPFEIKNNPNQNYIVVTSDRELTLRLNKIGVTCIRSGTFYKGYLKELAYIGLDDEDNTNIKKEKDENSDENMTNKKNKTETYEKRQKKDKYHWKKYIKNRFSDNSSSSSSSDTDYIS